MTRNIEREKFFQPDTIAFFSHKSKRLIIHQANMVKCTIVNESNRELHFRFDTLSYQLLLHSQSKTSKPLEKQSIKSCAHQNTTSPQNGISFVSLLKRK